MAKEYIEREAVLKKQIGVVVYDEGGWDANVRAVPVEDIEAIPAADVVEVKWIPVTERLPEDNQKVLICSEKGTVLIMSYDHYWEMWRGFGSIHVTHWMPLPEPPEMDGGADYEN